LQFIKSLSNSINIKFRFTNKDDSTGTLYLISNDLSATAAPLETIYQKRWKVEVFHKSIKSNTSMAKSPARTVRTQSNPIFMPLYATARLEILSAQHPYTIN
jgi:hypothetical protein